MQVIEGKNISPNHDLLHSFYTIDGYVQVTVNSEAGATSLSTRSERGNVSPVWNQMLTFSDVALGNTLTVSLFDHKKLSSDVLLGQVYPPPPPVQPSRVNSSPSSFLDSLCRQLDCREVPLLHSALPVANAIRKLDPRTPSAGKSDCHAFPQL
jgi:hypothetical protein